MGFPEKRGPGRWRARYRDPGGKERSKTFPRKIDAERFLASVEADKVRGQWVDPRLGQTTFGEYAAEVRASKAHLRPGTRQNIDGRLDNHLLPYFGEMPLGVIRTAHVRGWIAEMNAKGLSGGTVKAAYWLLGEILAAAEVDGCIGRSPCAGIDPRKDLPRSSAWTEMMFLSPVEVAQLAGAIDDRYTALVYAAAYTGLRWGELAALTVERIDLLKGTVHVAESLAEVNGRLHLGPTKTRATRTVSVPRFLAEMIGEHLGRYPSRKGHVFSSAQGLELRRRNFYRRHYRPAVLTAGLDERLRFHDLRHTCAALLIAQGAHPKELQERLGHSTIRLTFDRYGHLLPSLDERLREGLQATYTEALAACPRPAMTAQVTTLPAQGAGT